MSTPRAHFDRGTPRDRLRLVDAERVAVKVARDCAKHIARITTGEDVLPVGHIALRDRLREVIADELRKAQEAA